MNPKFRVWFKELNKMSKPFTLFDLADLYDCGFCCNGEDELLGEYPIESKNEIVIMQWTEWDDSFKNPIFIGDIIEHEDNHVFSQGIIEWEPKYKEIQCRWIGNDCHYCMYELFNPGFEPPKPEETVKILGNIYEHPNMINEILALDPEESYHPNPKVRKLEKAMARLDEEIQELQDEKAKLLETK